jgi:hypothetical protein
LLFQLVPLSAGPLPQTTAFFDPTPLVKLRQRGHKLHSFASAASGATPEPFRVNGGMRAAPAAAQPVPSLSIHEQGARTKQ